MCDNNSEQKSKRGIIRNIKENYARAEKALVEQLYMKHSLHPNTCGSAREDIWKQLFEMIIPKKFVIEQSVFIIDSTFRNDVSQVGISKEVDLAIIDETYTPYIFRYGRIKFVPIEAVAVVVECKSGSVDTQDWCTRIDALKTSDRSIIRIAPEIAMGGTPTQKATRPIKILCSMDAGSNKDLFDIWLIAHKEHIEIDYNEKIKNLHDAYIYLNHDKCFDMNDLETYKSTYCKVFPSRAKVNIDRLEEKVISNYEIQNNSFLSFNFQLNQLLMLINNPLLFPHLAYVDMFNEKEEKDR